MTKYDSGIDSTPASMYGPCLMISPGPDRYEIVLINVANNEIPIRNGLIARPPVKYSSAVCRRRL